MNKIAVILVCLFLALCFSSCGEERWEDYTYPSNIIIPGYGTLKYTGTLWDGSDSGTVIHNAIEVDNDIWIHGGGNIVYKGINKSAAIYIWEGGVIRRSLMKKGHYVLLFLEVRKDENDSENKYYITRIHKDTLHTEYMEITGGEANWERSPDIYYYDGDVFFHDRHSDYYYVLNDDCDGLIEIDEETFDASYFPDRDPSIGYDKGYYYFANLIVDGKGRYYRSLNVFHDEMGVSVDSGKTWYYADMGTNDLKCIIIQNDTVYAFCSEYTSWSSGVWSPNSREIGGGIHIFQWLDYN
ncbi:MAG: hypothetical protein LBG95_06955 [Treponema sp.]|jgi:hypothetical protein|nr:hypothetical protein [Treponema sp.]